MDIEKIKEAIKIVSIFKDAGNPPDTECIEAMQILLSLAEEVINAKMPQDDVKYTKCPCEKLTVEHNQMLIDDFRLWHTKCLVEIERTIREFIPHKDEQYILPLTQAIRNLFKGEA
jgi:hypothetical protein